MTKENDKIDRHEHIEQSVTGSIQFENNRFVDLALKKEHLRQIIDGAEEMLRVIESKEEINK